MPNITGLFQKTSDVYNINISSGRWENETRVENKSSGRLENKTRVENKSSGRFENETRVENKSSGGVENEQVVLYAEGSIQTKIILKVMVTQKLETNLITDYLNSKSSQYSHLWPYFRLICDKFKIPSIFHWLGPLGWVSHRVAMSVCLFVCLFVCAIGCSFFGEVFFTS